ncbi:MULTISPECIES: SDR family oxidoreductase [Bacillus]|uniref:Short-chain dehydrogenase n=2 Tax=Bacillus TaxID=1386 RepID=A0A0M4FS71_9BACI|nr:MULTISPECIES: SDR family oxidoreductase [Bacillus]ALC82347.1 short-chain dehydrogenase [Bacillus gobiensis]MBP1081214.1 NAD(P)-dependent dehydrogenase (short-subunit alcohol dehydrogenase family) [Bacillus capparidis]MED1095894.1 SDR family oxidoreductase [Bacillus capparidis]
MSRLQSKVALITGASSGIGKATAERFAKEGANVLCADLKFEETKETVERINAHGGKAKAYEVDISDENKVKRLKEQIEEEFGSIDILFNNAGTDTEGGKVHEYPVELWDKLMAVDLRGTYLVSKYFIPLMLEQGGSIINNSSVSGLAADLDRSGYNAAKGGITNLTKAMAIDYARDGIRVNCIAPGTIETPLLDDLMGEEGGKEFRKAYKWVDPMGRLGRAEEVAGVVLFLASDDSSYVTGESITVDGGHMSYTWPGKMLYDKTYTE